MSEEIIAAQRARIAELEADAAALLVLVRQLNPYITGLEGSHPGQALLAELAAARALIGTLDEVLAGELSNSALRMARVQYEVARKGVGDG